MNITIKTTGATLNEAIQSIIEKKVNGLEKFAKNDKSALLECEIEQSIAVERQGAKYRAEGNLTVGGKLFRAEALDTTLEGAVGKMRDDLQRQLRDEIGKRRSLFKRGGARLKQFFRSNS